MAEQPVFWLGGSPGKNKNKNKGRENPEAETYEPALRDACVACGFAVDEYVAAQGGFGGWLAYLDRNGERYRLFWSGKSQTLSFEQSRPHGWEPLREMETGDDGLPGFVDAVRSLLRNEDSAS